MKDVLVSTDWVDEHKDAALVRLVEVDVDTKAHAQGHIKNAVGWNWQTQLCDTLRRDVISREALEKLLGESGIDNATTIVLYGDNNNWFACWAFWQLKMFGHEDVRIMDGGRKKWLIEGRRLTLEIARPPQKKYSARPADHSVRAFLTDVMEWSRKPDEWAIVDVRSTDEYTGKVLCPPGLPETCLRGGHIPGAVSVPWGKNVNEDGTFKSPEELAKLYQPFLEKQGIVTYCRIGERSSLTWFVLKYLLGLPRVLNYDGSWTEWGNLVNAPIARGNEP